LGLIVQKYGGSSLGDADKIRHVARRVMQTQKAGNDVVVVVSAMYGETDRLVGLVNDIAPDPDPREYDVVVSTGEQVTIGLLALALGELGIPARSFAGWQVQVKTDDDHARARILSIDTERIRAELARGAVVVLPGFQGIGSQGDITTLGRGGSDTSGVAVAAALQADECEIYTDVQGVFTSDPGVVPDARMLSSISYEEMLEMASLGAKVLQIRSVKIAQRYGIPIHVRSTFSEEEGTRVVPEQEIMERLVVSGVTYNRDEAKITVQAVPDKPGIAARLFSPLSSAGVVIDVIVQNVSHEGFTDMTFTVPRRDLQRALPLVEGIAKELGARGVEADDRISKVSVVGLGMKDHAGVAGQMFQALSDEGINIEMINTSEIKISVVIEEKYTELACRTLHDVFGLGQSEPVEEDH
jgi:aspartate kinase